METTGGGGRKGQADPSAGQNAQEKEAEGCSDGEEGPAARSEEDGGGEVEEASRRNTERDSPARLGHSSPAAGYRDLGTLLNTGISVLH
jgi:hypothetical protein